jgi:hypothetical protein
MIRPAERFAVNVIRREPAPFVAPRRLSPLTTLALLAGLLGAGLGGILPAAWPPAPVLQLAFAPAAIEPAAGPAAVMDIPRAPDRRFYASVLLDRVPVTMELAPGASHSLLAPADAGRLAVGVAAGAAVPVTVLELGAARVGPVLLPVAGAPASVLGADILDRMAVLAVEGDRLRLTAR